MTSKIKVDNIENQCGGAVVTKCGATTTISGSVVKADDIQAADGGNLINQCGTTITLGASGDTINLASGASQTGFGRTGTVDWDTTPKTSTVTAANGVGYFVDTTSGSVTVNLPAGSAGDIVAVADYANTADTNKIVIAANGTEKIQGASSSFEITVEGGSVTLVYVDSTQGWRPTDASTAAAITETNTFIVATGGTITCCGDYKIHTFTGPGTFCVSAASGPVAVADYLVVAGGSGGATGSGGGGAGGFRESVPSPAAWSASPLAAPGGALPVSVTGYPIVVGGGGAAATTSPTDRFNHVGSVSSFSSIISAGGGGLTSECQVTPTNGGGKESKPGSPGGSGSGAGLSDGSTQTGGAGNTPPVSPPQGQNGGAGGNPGASGGGGGAGAVGGQGGPTYNSNAGSGGNGVATSITGSSVTRAGGGGGGGWFVSVSPAPGGSGGGGRGAGPSGTPSLAGTVNTGGGGGGDSLGASSGGGAAGGSGIVVIRYKFQ
jgi:hypothetical protein